ncbi:MAG: hypothetical protein DCC71_19015 [Proteobacteria bacterium]|nr:MAG: hypothetical protein DCC71_19015 [Pseudomonadota bacterium]
MRARARAGFTLLEMLAVMFLISLLVVVAIDFYLDLSRASNAAAEQTRSVRRAVVLLDRVARDLEGAVLLVKPPDVDPLAHPWLFLAESEDPDAGADRIKFVRRGHAPASTQAAESDLEMVAWIAEPGLEGDVELRRARWAQLPDGLDRSFPSAEQSDLFAGGLASFGVRLQDESGGWTGRWDSSTLAGASELPIAAEIEVSFATGVDGEVDGPYVRRVLLPLRPLDLAAELAEAAGQTLQEGVRDEDGDGDIDEDDAEIAAERQAEEGGEEDEDCVTVAQCLGAHPEIQQMLSGSPQAQAVVNGSMGQCARDFAGIVAGLGLGGLPPDCQ